MPERSSSLPIIRPTISIVFPAYQEEKRIGMTMESWASYLDAHHPGSEVVVVTDGCSDNTAKVAFETFKSDTCTLRLIEISENQGKGNAVKVGVMEAQGNVIVFTDSDLSYEPQLLDQFLEKLPKGPT
jgi:glycosyltransferase involved in cell wall biosynthesis